MPLSNEPAYLTGLIRRGSRACDRHGTLFLCFKLRRINRLGIASSLPSRGAEALDRLYVLTPADQEGRKAHWASSRGVGTRNRAGHFATVLSDVPDARSWNIQALSSELVLTIL